MTTTYKVMNVATGEFMTNSGYWGKTGKTWNRKCDLSNHLNYNDYSSMHGGQMAVVVEYELREVARHSISDWKSGVEQRREDKEEASHRAEQERKALLAASFAVGDVIVAKEGPTTSWLCSGCSCYEFAICCSVDPFVLVSEEGDMLWARLTPQNFRSIGRAPANQRAAAFRRYAQDYGVYPICE